MVLPAPDGVRLPGSDLHHVAQMAERCVYTAEAAGSRPAVMTTRGCSSNWIERLPCKQGVEGSSPSFSTCAPRRPLTEAAWGHAPRKSEHPGEGAL